jgi:hypothetical protein
MKSKTLPDFSHGFPEGQVASKMELSTDQPVGRPVARDESVANDDVNEKALEALPRCPRRRQLTASTPNSYSRSSVSNVTKSSELSKPAVAEASIFEPNTVAFEHPGSHSDGRAGKKPGVRVGRPPEKQVARTTREFGLSGERYQEW